MNRIPLPCILGPTGAGKSAAALALAARLPVAVINADSRQVYKDFPIITAQPSTEEQRRCPHLLYGFLDTREQLSAGGYARLATKAIAETQSVGCRPVLVGGTGLYVRALLHGIADIPAVPEAISRRRREQCNAEGSPALYALLRERDPAYAARIHPNDRQRIMRALDVLEATGKPFSWWHAQPVSGGLYRPIKVGMALPLAELEPILSKRIDAMLDKGALAEAEAALERMHLEPILGKRIGAVPAKDALAEAGAVSARCADATAPGWSGIGCAEIYGYLTGAYTFEECRAVWLRNTRAYAKRQITWFRADRDIAWFRPEQTEEAAAFIMRELGGSAG